MPLAGDRLTQVSNVLPTGTFLAFQALAASVTNNGDCGVARKVVISIGLVFFSILCCFTCFTDSYREDGKLYYGIVTSRGLWNPFFKSANIAGVQQQQQQQQSIRYITLGDPYVREWSDFVNAGVSVTAFATLTLLTPPVTTCFYRHIAGSIVETVPLFVVVGVAIICAFTNSRHGIGFVLSPAAPATPAAAPATPAAAPATPAAAPATPAAAPATPAN
ncbi:hypothetical protein CY35_01G109500 [Sphagnum magellanicum]|nr:hypothetical protein CY35_01G109500 [Sphagnum magellanicum]